MGHKVFYCYTIRNLGLESSANIVSVSENMVILICVMSYPTVLTISSVPSWGKNEKLYEKQHEQIRIRIHSKSSAYRRDSCSNGFDLIPKQKEIREVKISIEFCWLK